MQDFDIHNSQIELAIVLKLQQIQREELPNLTYKNIEDVLYQYKWVHHPPRSLHDAVNDILSLTADKIVRYLSKMAIIEGYNKNLSDYTDLIGGKSHE
ncbi:post-transcriptional regulator [Anaerorhabdus furcosa]|uniref:Post-transcriptional regulator n=1 Tax=Anaerorhabdus furcosa TaxID=118967 RepID=A0A1T4P0A0_9FIRM|nr:post-transcriptional regulator [Anaerorhabdus furcosa]SJZ84859.1 Post-transcriptional regulator [Anaerorhabdus furcosa]